jgi:hypothetical protein
VYPGHSGYAIDVERYTGMAQIAAVDLPEDMAADSVSVSFWLRKQDAYVSPLGDALVSWTHGGALHKEAHQSKSHVEKLGSYIALLMMPDSKLNFTAYHEGVVCTAISPRVPHLKDERWHHVGMSVDDAREVVRFSVDNADAAMPLVCLWLSTPPPPPSPPPSPPSPPPPNPPPSPPSPPSPPPSPPSPPPLRYRSPDQEAAAAKSVAAHLGGAVQEEEDDQYATAETRAARDLGDEDEDAVEDGNEDDKHVGSGPGLSGAFRSLLGGCSRQNCQGSYYRVFNCNEVCGGGQYMNRFRVTRGASCGGSCNYPDRYYSCNTHARPPPPPLPPPPPPLPPPPLPDTIPLEDQIDGPGKAATTESHSYLVDPTEEYREYSSSSSNSSAAAGDEMSSSKLDSPDCWSAKQAAFGADGAGLKAAWMQIAVSRELRIRGVAVRRPNSGSSASFVTKLKVLVGASADALYPVVGGVFETGLESAANATVVRLTFPGKGVLGKVVRIVPLTWVGDEVALRAAIVADSAAWPEHEVIDPPEESRKYSSVLAANPASETANSRLASPTGWTAANATKGEWLKIDLGRVTSVAGVALRSKWRSDELVTKVGLKVSDAEDGPFVDVQGGELVTGCVAFDDSTRALFLPTPVSARYIRIEALSWQNAVSLRAGVIVVRAEAIAALQPTDAESKATAPASLFQGRHLHTFTLTHFHRFSST